MFKKLVTNLPYSPGLLNQVSFYYQRLRRENFSRKLGLIFISLAVFVQILMILNPTEPSLASSTNDIIYGGGNKAKILDSYRNNRDDLGRTDIRAIFNRFGIEEHELARAEENVQIQSRAENDYYSIGREARFSPSIEHPVEIPGHNPVYIRPLHAWDSGAYSTYYALHGVTDEGLEFWVLNNCGNMVIKGPNPPTPKPEEPELQIKKSVISPASPNVAPGDTIEYEILYRNIGKGNAAFMSVKDIIPDHAEYVDFRGPSGTKFEFSNGIIKLYHDTPYAILVPSDFWYRATLVVKVKNDTPNGTEICNVATIASEVDNQYTTSTGAKDACRKVVIESEFTCTELTWAFTPGSRTKGTFTVRSEVEKTKILNYVINPGDGKEPIIITTDKTSASVNYEYADEIKTFEARARVNTEAGRSEVGNCITTIKIEEKPATFACLQLDWNLLEGSKNRGIFTVTGQAENTNITGYIISPGENLEDEQIISGDNTGTLEYQYPAAGGNYTATAFINTDKGSTSSTTCVAQIEIKPPGETIIVHEKLVSNLTQQIENANNTIAQPGDSLEYSLQTTNQGDEPAKNFELPVEKISDILEYADITELGDATFDEDSESLSWEPVDIQPGEIIVKKFTVQVKDPLPQTNISASDPGSFDLLMNNVYGDSHVEVRLPTTPAKTIERVTKELPNTGPGSNIALSVFMMMVTVYFYSRNRMITKELKMIEAEFRGGL